MENKDWLNLNVNDISKGEVIEKLDIALSDLEERKSQPSLVTKFIQYALVPGVVFKEYEEFYPIQFKVIDRLANINTEDNIRLKISIESTINAIATKAIASFAALEKYNSKQDSLEFKNLLIKVLRINSRNPDESNHSLAYQLNEEIFYIPLSDLNSNTIIGFIHRLDQLGSEL
jgi:hypothetical protein